MKLLTPLSVMSPVPTLSTSSLVLVSHGPWLLSTGKLRARNSSFLSAAWDSLSQSSVLKLSLLSLSCFWEETPQLEENLEAQNCSRPSHHQSSSSSGSSMWWFLLWKLMVSSNQDSKKFFKFARKKVNLSVQTLCCDSKRLKNFYKIPTLCMRWLRNLLPQSEPLQVRRAWSLTFPLSLHSSQKSGQVSQVRSMRFLEESYGYKMCRPPRAVCCYYSIVISCNIKLVS